MFLPLKDHNPTRNTPYVTIALIVLNLVVWFYELAQGADIGLFMARWGATPYELTNFTDLVGPLPGSPIVHVPGPPWIHLTSITSMFLHAGWGHVLLNLHFLWIFGNNVEDVLGPRVPLRPVLLPRRFKYRADHHP